MDKKFEPQKVYYNKNKDKIKKKMKERYQKQKNFNAQVKEFLEIHKDEFNKFLAERIP